MKRIVLSVMLFLGLIAGAFAQSGSVITVPGPRASGNSSSTIAVTNTFQSVFAANVNRVSCAVQNHGTNTMWVFFGPIASATKAKSVTLSTGQAVNCSVGVIVLTDQVSVTGTAADEFFAAVQ